SGLSAKYPEVDWRRVRSEFQHACAWPNPGTHLPETPNTGLARFVWDVRDAGGRVVFSSERYERHRSAAEELLAEAGVPDSTLLLLPDQGDRADPASRARQLRELGDSEVLAVFGGRQDHRAAVV